MPRSGAAARLRLRAAALDLFSEQGWDRTTTAQIAAAAGVTERTYFRHFADKREVLFDGEAELLDRMVEAVGAAPVDTDPLTLAFAGYRAAVPLVVANRAEAERRAVVIALSPALQERAHAKAAGLQEALVGALAARDVPTATARLAARTAAAAFEHASTRWNADPGLELGTALDDAAAELRDLAIRAR